MTAARKGPGGCTHTLFVRIDKPLHKAVMAEAKRLGKETGFPVSQADVVRLLLRRALKVSGGP